MSHTPGPWKIDGQFDAEIAVGIYSGDMNGAWTGICELEPFLEDWTDEEIANAHILAASASMFEALNAILIAAEGSSEQLATIRDLARRAILRASVPHIPAEMKVTPAQLSPGEAVGVASGSEPVL
jgi:hypothetical protein